MLKFAVQRSLYNGGRGLRTIHLKMTTTQENLRVILGQAEEAQRKSPFGQSVRLVAVSKTKPSDLIRECYSIGQRHFGENYVQELEGKAAELRDELSDVKWHYIGQVQSNKIGKISAVPNLFCVETLSSIAHCSAFEKEVNKRGGTLSVFIQVNTSNEEQKGGVSLAEAPSVGCFVLNECPSLNLLGFMTIGSVEGSSQVPNPDFDRLVAVRKEFCSLTGKKEAEVELSMGMSDDFETAIVQGSTSVRVGSKIFGARIYKK